MSDVRADLGALVDDITAAPGGPDRLWDTVNGLGLHTIGVPEEDGGSGGDLGDLVTVVRHLARRAACTPVAEHAVAAWTLARAGRSLPIAGPLSVALSAVPLDSGPLPAVPWGRDAVGLVVVGPDGQVRYADLDSRQVTVREGANLAGEPRDDISLRRIPLAPLTGAPAGDAVRARIGLLRAAAVAGACAGAYDLTRTYVTGRRQFGRPLIAIHAVATSLATMKVSGLQLDAAVERALGVDVTGADPGDLLAATAVARVVAAEAAGTVARIAHQLHGAMGVTREYGLHPLTTRLWAWRDEGGDEESWARLLGAYTTERGETGLWERLTAPEHLAL
jgi:acyl-CoA dehydrogenase